MKRLIAVFLAFLFVLPTPVFAGGRQRVSNVIIEQRVVESGFYPNVILVPSAQLGVPYYYQVNTEALRGEGLVEAIAERTSERVLEKLIEALNAGEQPELPVEPENPETPWGPENPELPPAEAPEDSITNAVTALISQKCINCHGNGNRQGELSLLENGVLTVTDRASRWDIFDTVQTGKMPKNGEPLSDVEVELIRQWARLK